MLLRDWTQFPPTSVERVLIIVISWINNQYIVLQSGDRVSQHQWFLFTAERNCKRKSDKLWISLCVCVLSWELDAASGQMTAAAAVMMETPLGLFGWLADKELFEENDWKQSAADHVDDFGILDLDLNPDQRHLFVTDYVQLGKIKELY